MIKDCGSGTLVPNGWGWEGALGSFLRHGTPSLSLCTEGVPQ